MNWDIQIQDGIKTIEMSGTGSNAMDLEFLHRLDREFGRNDNFNGVVLAGNGQFFSAGLNLLKLVNAGREEVKEVIQALGDTLLKVMTFPGPVMAVVNGHAVAGGCLLALSCDYRVGTPGHFKLGVNELGLGVDLPPVALAAVRKAIPTHRQFAVAALGKLFSPEEAVSAGILNELAVPEEALASAHAKAHELATPLPPFQRLKERLLAPELERIENDDHFADEFADQWFDSRTQGKIKSVVARLKGK
ncbi:MAG: enoyl-CoA hydratase/isomerase family protein [Fidelibacterota bacterium]